MERITSHQEGVLSGVANRLETFAQRLRTEGRAGQDPANIDGIFWRLGCEMAVIAEFMPVSAEKLENVAMTFARMSLAKSEAVICETGTRDGADARAAARTVSL